MTVERFLSKFKRCTKHYQWNRTERRFQLEAALKGAPEEIITEGGDDMSEREIIREMKLRYGNASRIRSFRTQLETVKQLPGQSLQDVYHEVKRILTLAYPTTDRETKESIGCNAFFRALTDQDMSTNLQVQDPEDLAEALTIALRLEPIYKANIGKKVTGWWRRLRRTYGSWRRRTTLTCATRSGGCRRNWGTRKGTSSHGGPRTSDRANLRPSLTNLLNLVRSRTRPYSRRHWLHQYLLGLALHSRRWLHNLQLQFVYPPHGYAPSGQSSVIPLYPPAVPSLQPPPQFEYQSLPQQGQQGSAPGTVFPARGKIAGDTWTRTGHGPTWLLDMW